MRLNNKVYEEKTNVTPWDIISYKSMFNCIYCVIWLYDTLEWVEICLELVMCEFIDMDVELWCQSLMLYERRGFIIVQMNINK